MWLHKRRANPETTRSAVLSLIADRCTIARSAIARELGLSRSTLTRVASSLVAEGLVREGEEVGSRVGRKMIPLELNPRYASFVVLDLSSLRMRGALAQLGGHIVERVVARPIDIGNREHNLTTFCDLVSHLLQRARAEATPVTAIAVGAPSLVNNPGGVIVWAPSLGWKQTALGTILRDRFGLPSRVENDANLAALSERWRGSARSTDDFVYLSVGTGLGAGIVAHGQLWHGYHRAAGEPGYIVTDRSYLGRRYERFGCLESLAAKHAILSKAQAAIDRGEAPVLAGMASESSGELGFETVLAAAAAGDATAAELTDEMADYLSIAVVNIACILDPRLIVLGGTSLERGALLLKRIRKQVEGVVPAMPELILSALGDDAVLLGAIAVAQEDLFRAEEGRYGGI